MVTLLLFALACMSPTEVEGANGVVVAHGRYSLGEDVSAVSGCSGDVSIEVDSTTVTGTGVCSGPYGVSTLSFETTIDAWDLDGTVEVVHEEESMTCTASGTYDDDTRYGWIDFICLEENITASGMAYFEI